MRATVRFGLAALCGLMSACSGAADDPSRPDGDAGADAGDVGGAPHRTCRPPLEVAQTEAFALRSSLYTIVVTGGTSDPRFELVQNESGAVLNERTGAYLAGPMDGTTDRVRVFDAGCRQELMVTLRVVEPLKVRPAFATAEPGSGWQFESRGGSGRIAFGLQVDESGATLTRDGRYTAGPMTGADRIEVTDLETGQVVEANVEVTGAASLEAKPSMVLVAVGQEVPLGFEGGSGFIELEDEARVFELIDGRRVAGRRVGRQTVQVLDAFTGGRTTLTVGVSESPRPPPLRTSDGLFSTTIAPLGDQDGDGFIDVAVAHPDADILAHDGGAVFVYQGGPDGPAAEPVEVIAGANRSDELGRALDVADFDGDGRLDLLIGAPRVDAAGADAGAVYVHLAKPDGWFSDEPDHVFSGVNSGDRFGWSVTACDFDGDGRVDVAAGAYDAEDRRRPDPAFNQGSVSVFRASPDGFDPLPAMTLWGDVPDGAGGWDGVRNMRLGADLASGDVDGDGACDLVASSTEWEQEPNSNNDGAVLVFRGRPASQSSDVVAPRPSIFWANLDPANRGAEFGRNLAVGDVDEDGRDDVLIGMPDSDHGSGDRHGALRLHLGRELPEMAAEITPAVPADWQIEHPDPFDEVGFSVALADADGDGRLDVISGDPQEELQGSGGSAGAIRMYSSGRFGIPEEAPFFEVSGLEGGDQLGAAAGSLGDVDGDGIADLLAFAHFSDGQGPDAGGLFYVSSSGGLRRLGLPGGPSGSQFGRRGAIVGDVSGDGLADLFVTAPAQPDVELGRNAGAAYLVRGLEDGTFETEPFRTLRAFRRHSGFDQLGFGADGIGDFDGDGIEDFAVVGRFEDLPGNLEQPLLPDPECTEARNNAGAVFVFLGGQSGTRATEPAFIYYGPLAGDGLREVQGRLDFNGDGRMDLVVGSRDWDANDRFNNGGFALVAGRRDPPGTATRVICQAEFTSYGAQSNDWLGWKVTGLGDLDGDGCDEAAASAPLVDGSVNNQGEIRVVFGWGGTGCPDAPRMVALRSGFRNAQGGRGLGGGTDVNGDGVPDLAVGLPFFSNGETVGAAGIVDGARLRDLPKEAPSSTPRTFHPFFSGADTFIVGTVPGEEFGMSVAVVDWADGTAGLAVGSPLGDLGGVVGSGGVRVFEYNAGAGSLSSTPWAVFGGSNDRPGSRAGGWVQSIRIGDRTYLGVGAEWASAGTIENGAFFPFDISRP